MRPSRSLASQQLGIASSSSMQSLFYASIGLPASLRCRSDSARCSERNFRGPGRASPSHGDVLDLVGSTALSARIHPEDLREVIRLPEVRRRDYAALRGFVAKYMGDGVLVYFGYPQAHEDDAERAVRAGLDLNRSLRSACRRASVRSRRSPQASCIRLVRRKDCPSFLVSAISVPHGRARLMDLTATWANHTEIAPQVTGAAAAISH